MRSAFSLVELLVVIAIIAILAVIAVPQYNKYKVNSMYSKMEAQLHRAKSWAQSTVYIVGKFPNGSCDASNVNAGSIKCLYNASSDTIEVSPKGDLIIDSPFKAIFQRNSTDPTCGWVIITCPADNCGGLKAPNNSGNAKICVNTCGAEEQIIAQTNLYNTGTCP